jgi:uncharacterized membrane protein
MWYDILMLATFAWTGCFLAIASLRTMQIIVKDHIGWVFSWAFAGIALGLGGLGIYLGRFSRWNSWDIFLSPNEILYEVVLILLIPADMLSDVHYYTQGAATSQLARVPGKRNYL